MMRRTVGILVTNFIPQKSSYSCFLIFSRTDVQSLTKKSFSILSMWRCEVNQPQSFRNHQTSPVLKASNFIWQRMPQAKPSSHPTGLCKWRKPAPAALPGFVIFPYEGCISSRWPGLSESSLS